MKFQAKIPLENILKPQLDLDPEVNDPYINVLRPWNGRGRRNDKLTDAPLDNKNFSWLTGREIQVA